MTPRLPTLDRIAGCLVGTALGDAVGLPFEGLSPRRQARWCPRIDGPRFLFGRGMVSDDTEHTALLAQALLRSGGDIERFRRALGWSLRGWILAIPAGVGKATALACLRLWLFVPPHRSGVYSAGNGPAMRSALLGVLYLDDADRLRALVEASTRITHTDPLAEQGAWLVAVAAGCLARDRPFLDGPELASRRTVLDPRWLAELDRLAASLARGESTAAFAAPLGLKGVSGYILHTVPVALHAAISTEDPAEAIRAAVACGGDADTTGAIAGALAGARHGRAALPAAWINRMIDWPLSVAWLDRVAAALHGMLSADPISPSKALPVAWWALPGRNLAFLLIVLAHGLRRLLPPY